MVNNQQQDFECMYCTGQGYFQLLLGGSETCPNCEGTGKE
ncbi:YuiA family protein [Bacillus sp. Marseille-P3661]|nr:YuiA family protein [Bacillus sp. Marseille-P3661]